MEKISVVIPCYKVTNKILNVINLIDSSVLKIYVVDDCCPDKSGDFVKTYCEDKRVTVLYHNINQGVGAAVMSGYREAIKDGMEIIVKVDGDGQMNPSLIPNFIDPIVCGEADYTKGNRFYNLEEIGSMPKIRLFGNACLSLMTKLSSGYWQIFDPTNGFTAIHANVARQLPLSKISSRYFFETDMLFRLNTLRAVVVDVPMNAVYEDEVSNLKIHKILPEFIAKHCRNFMKRIFYNYFLRDMSLASIELLIGVFFILFGLVFGVANWVNSKLTMTNTPVGTVVLVAITIILGTQLLLGFLAYDINSMPSRCLHKIKRFKT
ncbi:glycosyltransferase family 2 protein [Polynucleobacter hallstattensis]|uniref:glycosyltransferase family 2 protein n=1 Tax=Polynucleobacter hallstattensis TaxID=1855586 RepID=UPI001C0AAB02|nr:glycosyltransferase family 2 protein [Polynucleobacter hallstattensis]MBU3560590.1 glycosyltransferase family 2 protein [Polynucleobacter hallstattensis]